MARYDLSDIHATPVAEGVRLRMGSAMAMAVRRDSADIALRLRRERRHIRDELFRIPFLRGIARLVFSVADFLDGVLESAELRPQAIVKGTRFEKRFAELFRVLPTNFVAMGSALVMLILLVGLTLIAPMLVRDRLLSRLDLSRATVNGVICAMRVLGALIAIAIIPRLRIFNRFCMYRGALNKVLNAYGPQGRRVTQESAMRASRFSGRSDAAFVTTVALLAIIAYALVRTYTLPVQLLIRLLLLAMIAAIIGEPIYFMERAPKGSLGWTLLAPQRWLERLFVRKPHAQMVEVAICAFNAARENDEN